MSMNGVALVYDFMMTFLRTISNYVSKSREKSYGNQAAPKLSSRSHPFYRLCLGASLCNSGLLVSLSAWTTWSSLKPGKNTGPCQVDKIPAVPTGLDVGTNHLVSRPETMGGRSSGTVFPETGCGLQLRPVWVLTFSLSL